MSAIVNRSDVHARDTGVVEARTAPREEAEEGLLLQGGFLKGGVVQLVAYGGVVRNVEESSQAARSSIRCRWKEQTWEVPLIVSMSFEESVEGVISLSEMEGLTIIRHGRKMSQFEHYKALAELDWGDGTWVMFTDDDDLWHEARAEAYVTMLQE
ncbi:g9147 [Coccomyxa elongata]